MIFQVENNPEIIKNGQYVAFVTGKKTINTYPHYLRIGQVVDAEKWKIKELSTGKIWQVYSQAIIKVDKGIPVFGVEPTFKIINQI